VGSIADLLDDDARARLAAEPFPSEPTPMLATLAREAFDHPDWLFERKLDGQRVLLAVRDGRAQLRSRRGERLDATYPEVIEAAEAAGLPDLVADGEVVAFDGETTSFALLQQRMGIQNAAKARRSPVTVTVYLFDLLHLGGVSTRDLPLRTRKALLAEVMAFEEPFRLCPHRQGDGRLALEEACADGWEGLIAKDAASRYVAGRSRAWLKLKCSRRQEVVVGGFTDPRGGRSGFGALLVGVYEGGRLRYAGKVGTGYSQALLRDLGERLRALETDTSPFAERLPGRGVHFVAPELVAEVAFSEWTRDGRLRHPSFLGLRTDKDPGEVVRED
jgi:bifunctional non-homologous end joining protein LigD